MNVPAIAKRTFEELRHKTEFLSLVQEVLKELQQISSPITRAQLTHELIEEYNREVFSNPLVKQFSPCTVGCSACCHTQVSITLDEAQLLKRLIDEGVKIDHDRLQLQARAENDSETFYKLTYEERECIFLDEAGACRIYKDRPSVCRTNAVIGEATQCDTKAEVKPTRLIKTQKSDLIIYASFLHSKENGTLPFILNQLMNAE